jgi:protease secretion system membrane fusion protein
MARLDKPLKTPPAHPAAGAGGPPSDTGRAARLGLWVLGLGLGGFLLWATLAPLDEGVPSMGTVAIESKRNVVQHLSGGIIKRVLVREGQVVEAGQPLVELDDALMNANFEGVRQRYLGLRAVQGRLLAEQAGAAKIEFHPDLIEAASDPLIRTQMQTQEQLFRSRQARLTADLQAIEENISGQEGLLQSYREMMVSRRTQMALIKEELQNTREMVREGYAPRNRQLELERSLADVTASIADLTGSTVRAQRTIAELRQRAQSRRQEHRNEIEAMLTEVTRDVQSDAERMPAAKAELARTVIRAPAAGQVVAISPQLTIGGVVQPGERLMDIVPEGEPLLLEAHIPPHLIDRVHAGLETDIRFNAFSHSPQLVVQGKVVSVSGDLLTDRQGGTNMSYYLARVEVTPEGMETLGGRRMQPGMPAEVIIRTGERSLLTYLLGPLTKRLAASMTEE